MKLLDLNPLRDRPDRDQLEAGLARDAREITDADLCKLLQLDWRPRLTAAWLIALDRRTRFRDQLAELLFADEVVRTDQRTAVLSGNECGAAAFIAAAPSPGQ